MPTKNELKNAFLSAAATGVRYASAFVASFDSATGFPASADTALLKGENLALRIESHKTPKPQP